MEKSYDFRCQSLYFCKTPTQPNKNYREELDDQFGTVFYDVMWIWLVEAQWNQEADEKWEKQTKKLLLRSWSILKPPGSQQ